MLQLSLSFIHQRFGTSYVISFMIVLNEMVKHVHSITCELKLHTSPMQNKVSHKQLKRPICNAVPNAPL
jgi:hypothetical protein